jgi:hypothetical protein
MLNRTHNIENPVEEILSFLDENRSGCPNIRRRAVIYKEKNDWVLQACVVEGIPVYSSDVEKQTTREYSNACLFEDWLSPNQLKKFLHESLNGEFRLGDHLLKATYSYRQWSSERLPLSNSEMSFAGHVWRSKFSDHVNGLHGELIAAKPPYYPDIHEAVRDWLPHPVYHGSSDSRKGEIAILLPETRAYFKDITFHDNRIDLHISGVATDKLSLEVKGAWWDRNGIHHFSENIINGQVQLNVPSNANRLEYVLLDASGDIYDFQKEDGNRHTGLGRSSKAGKDKALASFVLEASRNGEGPKIEFKPFIDPEHDKLYEVIKTVVAFSNAEGGKIFLGINDGCELIGIEDGLAKWAKASPGKETCEKYIGSIKARIRDQVSKHVDMDLNQVVVDGSTVVVIEVGESKNKPVLFCKENKFLFIRRGASNVKTSPEEWKTICNTSMGMFGNII